MSHQEHVMKRHDREPSISRRLLQGGAPIDLTGCTVKFIMKSATGDVKVEAAAVIVAATTGDVRYDWTSADTDTAGKFRAEWEIIKPSTKPLTVPSKGYIPIIIEPDLNDGP